MGMWGMDAWDNDIAADWFGTLFDVTSLRETWVETMRLAASTEGELDDFEEPRAALWLFAQLGHVYIWPIDHLDGDIELSLQAAHKIMANEDLIDEVPEFLELVKRDRDSIAERRQTDAEQQDLKLE